MSMAACILDRTLLIISGGPETVPGIQRAKDMGLHVVVSDGNIDAPGFHIADDYFVASTYDISDTLNKAKHYHEDIRKIDGVICIASDVPLTVASVAKELGLPGISIETAKLAADKLAMKKKFIDCGIATPEFVELSNIAELKKVIDDWGFPLVLKPTDSRGARGVLKLTKDIDISWAWDHSKQNSSQGKLIVEKFLDGPQVSTEAIIVDGIGYPIGLSDRNYEYLDKFSPYIIENGGGFPSHINSDDQQKISTLAIKAGLALGITNGVAKGDIVLTEKGPVVIEIAARLSGGWFSTDQIPLGLGVDIVGAAIRIALGEKIDINALKPKKRMGIAVRYFFPEPGFVKNINFADKYSAYEWVHRLGFFVGPGEILYEVTNHTKRAGFVITSGSTKDHAVQRANAVISGIQIDTSKNLN